MVLRDTYPEKVQYVVEVASISVYKKVTSLQGITTVS